MRDLDDNVYTHWALRSPRPSKLADLVWYQNPTVTESTRPVFGPAYMHVQGCGRCGSVALPASAGKSPKGFYANLCARSTIFLQLNSNNFLSRTVLRGSHVQIWVNSGCSSLEVRHKLLSGILDNALVTVPDDICYPSF